MHINRSVISAAEKGLTTGLIGLMSMLSFMVLPVTASAAELTTESASLSDPTISQAATTYTFTQSGITLSTIKCIKVLYSVNADGTGGLPTGMTLGTTFSGTYVPTPASWSAAVVSNAVQITFAAGETPSSSGPKTIVLGGNTNGSVKNTSYYATVSTYNNIDCSTTPVDTNGQSTYVFTEGVVVSATVNPTLTFTVDSTTCSLGTLTASTTGSCSHTMTAATNATSGYAISYIASSLLTSGANTIDAMSATTSSQGTEQFGLNLKDNATPNVGAEASGGIGAAFAPYATADNFSFTTAGAEVASSTGSSALTTFTVSYIANITATTQAGLYTKTQTYNITATY